MTMMMGGNWRGQQNNDNHPRWQPDADNDINAGRQWQRWQWCQWMGQWWHSGRLQRRRDGLYDRGGEGHIHSPMVSSVPAKKLNAASPLFQDSDTLEDKNNNNDAAPTKFIFSHATKHSRVNDNVKEYACRMRERTVQQPQLTTEADKTKLSASEDPIEEEESIDDENSLFFHPDCTSLCITKSDSADRPWHKGHTNVVHASLNSADQYVHFPAKTFHWGYYKNQVNMTVITAQLFAVFKSTQSVQQSRKMRFELWNSCQKQGGKYCVVQYIFYVMSQKLQPPFQDPGYTRTQ